MKDILIREFQYPGDYGTAIELWESAGAGVRVGPSDAPEEIQKKLKRDPDLFLVAEAGSELIGTVMGGFDGRRGMVYHLAVSAPFRRRGVATQLMAELERRLRLKGCIRAYLVVFPDNVAAMRHYESIGWGLLQDSLYAKDLPR
jgi:ribosomal protein S18 acetylase RimI-like enzyme